jgi:hypothetical protein
MALAWHGRALRVVSAALRGRGLSTTQRTGPPMPGLARRSLAMASPLPVKGMRRSCWGDQHPLNGTRYEVQRNGGMYYKCRYSP